MTIIARKIGQNRGKPRLWIEGKALVDAGLDHGNRWDLVPSKDGFEIALNPHGARKIAGKPGRPIIDIVGGSLDPLRDTAGNLPASVAITFELGSGIMRVTPEWPAMTLPVAA